MVMLTRKSFYGLLKTFMKRKPRAVRSRMNEEAVTWGYRLLLGRDPENFQVINDKIARLTSPQDLIQELIQSDEFKRKNPSLKSPSMSGNEPPMFIEEVHSVDALQGILQNIQDSWKHLGEKEPYWSVITSEKFLSQNIQANEKTFYESGKHDIDKLFNFFKRNGIDYTKLKSCLEYGCGLGRATRWLAERFEVVYGYDISESHLNGAGQYLTKLEINNVILKHINQIYDIEHLPNVDLIYSIIVLQHNPPPLIKFIIRQFLRALNPGGIAFFQVPTYQLGYNFSLKPYLSQGKRQEMEMHVLPQSQVFDIISQEGGRVIEVVEDSMTGLEYQGLSNIFLLRKV